MAPPPTSGYIRTDGTTAATSSNFYIDKLDASGVDRTLFLMLMKVGDQLVAQDSSDATCYAVWTVAVAPVDNGTYLSVVANFLQQGPTILTGNKPAVLFGVRQTGTAGAQGPQGAAGPQGAQGVVGGTGPQGAQGAGGAQGASGTGGATGATGPGGPTGATGATGATGPTGPSGATGPQGISGPQGAVGANGSQGAQGAQGSQGSLGAQGPQGAQGVQGNNVVGVAGNTVYVALTTSPSLVANTLTSLGNSAALTGSYYFRGQVAITANAALSVQCALSTSATSVVWGGQQLATQESLVNNAVGTVAVTGYYFGMAGQTVYLLIKATGAATVNGTTGVNAVNESGLIGIRLL